MKKTINKNIKYKLINIFKTLNKFVDKICLSVQNLLKKIFQYYTENDYENLFLQLIGLIIIFLTLGILKNLNNNCPNNKNHHNKFNFYKQKLYDASMNMENSNPSNMITNMPNFGFVADNVVNSKNNSGYILNDEILDIGRDLYLNGTLIINIGCSNKK